MLLQAGARFIFHRTLPCPRGPSSSWARPPAQHSCFQFSNASILMVQASKLVLKRMACGFNAQCRRCFVGKYQRSPVIRSITPQNRTTPSFKKKLPRVLRSHTIQKAFHLHSIDLALVVVFTASYEYVDGLRRAIIEMNTQYSCPQVSPRCRRSLYTDKRRVTILRAISSFHLCKYYQP